ncbi:serpentine type 7TM GPCR chemoreceptor srd domain-containing protein [Ditylenchus destructor]|uniref:Serpentine type 7TM GPCR chemoreceptor srd domain-containing protein n=1 Tax=Ditylenchus destructor TaxID=166010 RepID=A0AAD4QZL1_9BILA|nr:serpentine type 7TM GPCR chemoreceptor srd domain-containing protein [Ditylenchus destructor]
MDHVHHITDTLINTVAILSNCYLLYLIRYHSTFGVKLYQHLLTIDSALDLFLCVSAFIAQPVREFNSIMPKIPHFLLNNYSLVHPTTVGGIYY